MGKCKKVYQIIFNYILLLTGITIVSLAFNIFFVPNNFISSGLGGISLILSHYVNITPASVIFFGNMIFIGMSILTLGMEKTSKYIVGSLLFTVMVYLTEDINTVLHIEFDNIILYVIASGVCYGIGEGLAYKAGYSSGGTSILALIISNYIKKPVGSVSQVIGSIIILMGGFTFGLTNVMYSIIIVYISTLIINKITIGISNSKMFLIYTSKEIEVVDYILNTFHNGVTKIDSKGVFTNKKKNLLMCVVPSEKYMMLISAIKDIDSGAFINVSDCYEVYGGTKKSKNLPFINN